MVNPVAGSFAERVPLLVLSGGPGDEERKPGTLIHHQAQEVESQLRIYREVTCAARVLDDPRTAAETVDEVVRTVWREQRPGYLEIHRDMVERRIPVPRAILEWDGQLHFERSRRAQDRRGGARDGAADQRARAGRSRWSASRRIASSSSARCGPLAEQDGCAGRRQRAREGRLPDGPPALHGRPHRRHLAAADRSAASTRADLVLSLGTMLTDMDLGGRAPHDSARPLDLGRRRARQRELPHLHRRADPRLRARAAARAPPPAPRARPLRRQPAARRRARSPRRSACATCCTR